MDLLVSGLVSAFAIALAVCGLVPFVLVLMDLRGARFSRHSVDVMNGINVLYVYLVGGAALTALGIWVLASQEAKVNALGLALAAGVVVWRARQNDALLKALAGLRRRGG